MEEQEEKGGREGGRRIISGYSGKEFVRRTGMRDEMVVAGMVGVQVKGKQVHN